MVGSHHLVAVRSRLCLVPATLGALACSVAALAGQVVVTGTATDRDETPVADVRVALEGRDPRGREVATLSDDDGRFRLELDRGGRYVLSATRAGFYPLKDKPVDLVRGANIVNIELVPSRRVETSLDVFAAGGHAADEVAMSQGLEEEEIDAIPATRSSKQRIQGIAAVLPGVLRDSKGDLHFQGGSAEETNWTLDGFDLSDPATGRLEMALGVESVQSLDLLSGRYSAAQGKGAGGAMVLSTRTGEDEFSQRFTNFVPGIDYALGLRIRDWRPRHNLSGPVLKGRAWFFNSLDLLYEENFIPELPPGEDRNASWSINNNLRLRAKLTPRQTLGAGFVMDFLNAPRSGLSPLDPIETTLDRRGRRAFFNVKEEIALSAASVLDFGYAAYHSSYRGVPQGTAPYRITSFGREGNYPFDTLSVSGRDQLRTNLFLPFGAGPGGHQLRAGVTFSHSRYRQDIRRSPIQYLRADGTRSSELSFAGSGALGESNWESGAYVQDRWAIRPRLVAELGVRWDGDRIVSGGALTPRFSLALSPPGIKGARLAAGLGRIPAATFLRAFTRHRDQRPAFTRFTADGETPLGPSEIRFFELDPSRLTVPSTLNLSASWRQSLPGGADFSVNLLRKRMGNGYAQVRISDEVLQDALRPVASHVFRYQLRNFKRDAYDSIEFALSTPLASSHRWFVSYTYSRAWSNAALEVDTDDSMRFAETGGRLPWDVPHRLVSWATIPLGEKTSVAAFAEWRDGFPFSVHDGNGKLVGAINSWRLPRQFNLNLHVQRTLTVLGHRWSLRPGVDNVTNRPNYSFVNNNVASPQFLDLFGRSPRKIVVRVRWLGKAGD